MPHDSRPDSTHSVPALTLWQTWKILLRAMRRRLFSYAKFLTSILPRRQGPRHAFQQPARHTAGAIKHAALSIPGNSWDSHMHVVDPRDFPLSKDAVYEPSPHTLDDAMRFEQSLGFRNIVLVQPSIYGYDNSCMLDAMLRLGVDRCRGVVAFDPAVISSQQIEQWHKLGVRGVRINLQSVGQELDAQQLADSLTRHADAIRDWAWVIQLYLPMHMIPLLEPIVPGLGVRICIDHMGHPALPGPAEYKSTHDPYMLPGFESLVRLLREGSTFVKLSAPYRISKESEDMADVTPVGRELLRQAGKTRVVMATDWPHTRFEGTNIRPWLETVLGWCGEDSELVNRLFQGNAQDLWQVAS